MRYILFTPACQKDLVQALALQTFGGGVNKIYMTFAKLYSKKELMITSGRLGEATEENFVRNNIFSSFVTFP